MTTEKTDNKNKKDTKAPSENAQPALPRPHTCRLLSENKATNENQPFYHFLFLCFFFLFFPNHKRPLEPGARLDLLQTKKFAFCLSRSVVAFSTTTPRPKCNSVFVSRYYQPCFQQVQQLWVLRSLIIMSVHLYHLDRTLYLLCPMTSDLMTSGSTARKSKLLYSIHLHWAITPFTWQTTTDNPFAHRLDHQCTLDVMLLTRACSTRAFFRRDTLPFLVTCPTNY